jgi:tRNA uridine 5-carboxymethylaminomethyl modification enzyme
MMTHTTAKTAEIVRQNLDKAPMYNGKIEGIGTRYCPSFEDKIVRFPDHEQHHIYLEPEGEFTDEYYLNGISTSLPPEVQKLMVRSIPGLENAVIARYAYAIEYDFIFPEELDRCLAVKKWKGLYHAGQVNGTSGYEEAAAQGLTAGLNAARYAAGKPGVEFPRDNSYFGVMMDDLVTKEIVEPYRLFTSRAEYRLRIRQDNADLRLCEIAYENGLISGTVYDKFRKYKENLETSTRLAKECSLPGGKTAWTVIRDMQGDAEFEKLPVAPESLGIRPDTREGRRIFRQLAIQAHYEGYIRQEDQAVARAVGFSGEYAIAILILPVGFKGEFRAGNFFL